MTFIDKYSNPASMIKSEPVDIARDMWRTRHGLPVGMTRSIEYGYAIILYRKSETDFVFMFSGMSRRDLNIVQDAIRGNWDEPAELDDDDAS